MYKHSSQIQKEFVRYAKMKYLGKKDDIFSYSEMTKDMWRDKVKEAQERFSIGFDLENNDSNKEKRNISFGEKGNFGNYFNFNCELFSAGGDWENPVYYFRCQLLDGHIKIDGNELSTYSNPHFVMIPPKEAGNTTLTEGGKDFKWHAIDNQQPDPEERDSKKAWTWLEKELQSFTTKGV